MKRREFTSGAGAVCAGSALWGLSIAQAAVSEGDAAAGIRSALERGATAAVSLLGRRDGFLGNPKVRIELPGALRDAARLAQFTGQQGKVDALVTAMNRAAEAAVSKARPLLLQAVRSMSVEDARQIVAGGDDSVTRFFEKKTRAPLTTEFLPVVTRETQKVALADKYNAVAGKAAGLGLLSGDDADLQRYVTARALDALYRMIGEEERKIRRDPVATGSRILEQVFGARR